MFSNCVFVYLWKNEDSADKKNAFYEKKKLNILPDT